MNFKELLEAVIQDKGFRSPIYTTIQQGEVFFTELLLYYGHELDDYQIFKGDIPGADEKHSEIIVSKAGASYLLAMYNYEVVDFNYENLRSAMDTIEMFVTSFNEISTDNAMSKLKIKDLEDKIKELEIKIDVNDELNKQLKRTLQ